MSAEVRALNEIDTAAPRGRGLDERAADPVPWDRKTQLAIHKLEHATYCHALIAQERILHIPFAYFSW